MNIILKVFVLQFPAVFNEFISTLNILRINEMNWVIVCPNKALFNHFRAEFSIVIFIHYKPDL